jgi:hypothetical protein
MAIMRALGGILLGTALAVLAGAVIDYLHLYPAEEAASFRFLYPWLAGLGGLLGSLLTALLVVPAALKRGTPTPVGTARTAAAKASAGVKPAEHVPGMPTFDLDALRQQTPEQRKANEGMLDKEKKF